MRLEGTYFRSLQYFYCCLDRYIGAQVPRRAAALVRKRAIVEGTYGSFDPLKGTLLFSSDDSLSPFLRRMET
jgi:hypothetical protein